MALCVFNDQNLNYITLDLDLLLSGKDYATWRMTLTAVHVKVYRVCQETGLVEQRARRLF